MAMSVKGIGAFWKRWEPGYKIITATVVLLGLLISATTWAYSTNSKIQEVDNIKSAIFQIRDTQNRMERNEARIAASLKIYIEPPASLPQQHPAE